MKRHETEGFVANVMPTLLTLAYLALMGWVIFAAAAEKVAR